MVSSLRVGACGQSSSAKTGRGRQRDFNCVRAGGRDGDEVEEAVVGAGALLFDEDERIREYRTTVAAPKEGSRRDRRSDNWNSHAPIDLHKYLAKSFDSEI
jgi:hypothetical protein